LNMPPGPIPLGLEQERLELFHNSDEKRINVLKKKNQAEVQARLRAASEFESRIKDERMKDEAKFTERFRPKTGPGQLNVEASMGTSIKHSARFAFEEEVMLSKLSEKHEREQRNVETARLTRENMVQRKRDMMEERFERLRNAQAIEERRQQERREQLIAKQRKKEENAAQTKRQSKEEWEKRKLEHQLAIETRKKAWYNKMETTEKEVTERMTGKFSKEKEHLQNQTAQREAELRERRRALQQHYTDKKAAYEHRVRLEQKRRDKLDSDWRRKLNELEELDAEVSRMLQERADANAEYWAYCQMLVMKARTHDDIYRDHLNSLLDEQQVRAREMLHRRALLEKRVQLLNHNVALSKEELYSMTTEASSALSGKVTVEPPPPMPEANLQRTRVTAAQAAQSAMAEAEAKRREAALDKLADSGNYHHSMAADVSIPRPKRYSRYYARPNVDTKVEFAKTL